MLRNPKKYLPKEAATWVEVPSDYQNAAKWSPRIGEFFPNFSGQSTAGKITFHPYTNGSWTIFFSIAAIFSEVCTKELIALSKLQDKLRNAGICTIGIARNSVDELQEWCDLIAARGGKPVDLPIIADPEGILTSTFGMIHPQDDEETTIRKTIIINPELKVSMLFEYPLYISRSPNELLRTLDAARRHYRDTQARQVAF